MRTDSDRNLSAEADPNPARKTRERVLTDVQKNLFHLDRIIPYWDVFFIGKQDVKVLYKEEVCYRRALRN